MPSPRQVLLPAGRLHFEDQELQDSSNSCEFPGQDSIKIVSRCPTKDEAI